MSSASEELAEYLASAPVIIAGEDEFLLETDKGGYQYPVDFARCDTPEKILRWSAHLLEKNWFTPRFARDFIIRACQRIGVNPFGV